MICLCTGIISIWLVLKEQQVQCSHNLMLGCEWTLIMYEFLLLITTSWKNIKATPSFSDFLGEIKPPLNYTSWKNIIKTHFFQKVSRWQLNEHLLSISTSWKNIIQSTPIFFWTFLGEITMNSFSYLFWCWKFKLIPNLFSGTSWSVSVKL